MQLLTPRIALELIAHEGLVPEAYRDVAGVWTWSVGITDASGHRVHPRYRDNPQPLEHCLAVYLWALRTQYLPPVLAAFGQHDPAEHELGAALSFHYNTGAIRRAEWLRLFLAGDRDGAREAFLNWSRPAAIVPRRKRERDLFFDGAWSGDGCCTIYEVAKPGYRPTGGRRQDVRAIITHLLQPEPQRPTVTQVPDPDPRCAAAPKRSRNWFERLFD